MNLKKLVLLFLLFGYIASAIAQSKKISGVVQDPLGDPLPGVSIVVKGTTNGTVTDFDGKFAIQVTPGVTLQCSFIGYESKDVKVSDQTNYKIVLNEETQDIEEVVVVAVGYGDVRRTDLTGSVGKANMADLAKIPVNNIAESLGGRVAGVSVSSGDGGLSENFNIVIRGAGSLTQSTAPLYVIDGFPQETSGLGSINPNDIESIDVLKDASATAIYGSRGANGVVIVTTKKGRAGTPKVTYNGSVTFSKALNLPKLMNGYEFASLQKEVMSEEKFNEYYLKDGITLDDYKTFKSFDWQDEIFRSSLSHSHHVSLNGQQGDLKYSTSLSYSNKEGVIINSNLEKYQGRINLSQKLGKKVVVDVNASYASIIQNGPSPSDVTHSASNSWMYSVWGYRPVSPSGSDLLESLYDEDIDMTNDYRFNPVLSAQNEVRKRTTNNLNANLGIEWEIIKNLKYKFTAGYSGRDMKFEEFNGSKTRSGNTHPNNTLSKGINAALTQSEFRNYLNENILTYKLNKKKHSFNVLGGFSLQRTSSYAHSIIAEHISNESFGMSGLDKGSAVPQISCSSGENTMMSYFTRLNYNYQSKYYATLSARADGSSKFPKHNRWGYFPSGSLAWAFGRENFVKNNLGWLNEGKLRVSYGFTGNNRIGDFAHLAQLITSDDLFKYPFDGAFNLGYVLGSMANNKLKWETTEQTDFGIDLSFLNNRLSVSADYYIKRTKDLLLSADVSASSGFSSAIINIGELKNSGVELTLESTNIETKNFTWTSSFNIAFNRNKIIALNSNQQMMQSFVKWDNKYNNMPAYISAVNEAAGSMYGFIYEGTYKVSDFDLVKNDKGENTYVLKPGIPYYTENCQPGDPKYKDLDGDNVISAKDRTKIGNGHPLHIGGFTNNFRYKDFDLNIFFQWSYGNDVYNANRMVFENPMSKQNLNSFKTYTNRWTFENQESNMPRAKALGSDVYSSLYVEDASFLKLKNVTLGYTFPRQTLQKMKLSNLRIFVSAENILTFTKYSGTDPEVSTRNSVLTPGFDWSAYPRAFSTSLGLNVTF